MFDEFGNVGKISEDTIGFSIEFPDEESDEKDDIALWILFNLRTYTPEIVYWKLKFSNLSREIYTDRPDFHSNYNVFCEEDKVKTDDYGGIFKKKHITKGHLQPIHDVRYSRKLMYYCSSMVNVSPQYFEFNRCIWYSIESFTRRISKFYDNVHVYTGCLYLPRGDVSIVDVINSKIHLPTHFYKILIGDKILENDIEIEEIYCTIIEHNNSVYTPENIKEIEIDIHDFVKRSKLMFFRKFLNYRKMTDNEELIDEFSLSKEIMKINSYQPYQLVGPVEETASKK